MTEQIVVVFIIAWFVFWGWMLATKPDTVFQFWKKSDDSMKSAGRVAGKVGGKILGEIIKRRK